MIKYFQKLKVLNFSKLHINLEKFKGLDIRPHWGQMDI